MLSEGCELLQYLLRAWARYRVRHGPCPQGTSPSRGGTGITSQNVKRCSEVLILIQSPFPHSWDNDLEPDPVTGDGDTGKAIVLAMMEPRHRERRRSKRPQQGQAGESGNYGRDTSHAKEGNS